MIIVNPALVSQNTGVDIEVRVTVGDKEYDGISVGDKVVGIIVGDKEVGIRVGDKVVGGCDG